MSVELYPDHKAVLHFQDSLKVYEVDFLEYLTSFLAQDEYAQRHFDIYVKPTLHHSAFDFIIVEPNHAIYIIQTPVSLKEFQDGIETVDYFYQQRLHTLSPTLQENIQKSAQDKASIKRTLIKQMYYLYDDALLEEFPPEETLIVAEDFHESSEFLQEFFKQQKDANYRLTRKESAEIKEILNPNTNIKNYMPKTLPGDYHAKVQSQSQAKQKFKGAVGSGKTIILVKRVIDCSNRLKETGRILVVAGDVEEVQTLKDLITAEAARSLQELGIDVCSYEDLGEPDEKYHALFVDDAQYIETKDFRHLLDNYLIEMTEDNDYEYVVMANAENLPTIPQILGPFSNLKFDLRKMTQMLKDSRSVFLEILNA